MKKIKTTSKQVPQNRILDPNFHTSANYYHSDVVLKHFLCNHLSSDAQFFMRPNLEYIGKMAAGLMNELSLDADKNSPRLKKRNFYGDTVDEVVYHPSYDKLLEIAVKSGMFAAKWQPNLRERFQKERHTLGFSVGFIYAMSESGQYCPLCMTDGVARLIDRYGDKNDKARLLPHIYTADVNNLYTGAMFLTEKAGGSDVGSNLVTATRFQDQYYHLNGEKWFCSNADADLIFALARPNSKIRGTKGLGIFLIERFHSNGERNPMHLVRLKDKLGTRSMASGEYILENTVGKLVGTEQEGFKIMTDIINLSRLYNSVAASASIRRGLIEVYQYLKYRTSFGTNALNHALIRTKLQELASINLANFYLTWHAIQLLDKADNGDLQAKAALRLLTPIAKKSTAEASVYVVRECMELMGGMGYIEDGILPKLMRDCMVLPIWEGAGNIMILDMLRASKISDGLHTIADFMRLEFAKEDAYAVLTGSLNEVLNVFQKLDEFEQSTIEATAKPLFERFTLLYQIALLIYYTDTESRQWTAPAIKYLSRSLHQERSLIQLAPDVEEIDQLIAWSF